jgi:DNA-binding response OmpR family regulator
VSNVGSGIPEEFRSRIFQRFAQADSSDTREKGGTGLGLSICKAIVDRHSGHIDYESKPDQRTVFYFDLPMWRANPQPRKISHSIDRVLICEDNPDVAAILEGLLQQEKLSSDIAVSAATARDYLQQHNYGVLLLDLTLPDMDGIDFLRELRSQDGTRHLPIIVISGRADAGKQLFNGSGVSVVDWLQKPLDTRRFRQALRRSLFHCNRPTVLHVEDDMDMVQITKLLIKDTAEYHYVPSLSQARDYLNNPDHTVDLVILDLNLTDGSGVELFNDIKGRCPVVVLSGNEPGENVTTQAAAALTKSKTSSEQLLSTIKHILDRSQEEL